MKKLTLAAALLSMAAVCTTSAISIDFNNDAPGSYPSNGPGYTVSGTGAVQKGSLDGQYAAPDGDGTNFLNVRGGESITFTFSTPQTYLSFLWGSVDGYNGFSTGTSGPTTFALSGINFSYTGQDAIDSGMVRLHDTFTYSSPMAAFTTLTFTSDQNSFELDDINTNAPSSVPDGGTTAALLGLAMVGIVVVRSKFSVA